jgi:dTDP-4-dehydrorhamnose reductase
MTNVDLCESEPERAFLLNEQGTANVAAACKNANVRLIAISTDYVFKGDSPVPYPEDIPADGGATVYGKSKFAGEQAVRRIYPENSLICRISWLYGFDGPSFVHTMLKLADGTRPELKVVHDQKGNPTSAIAVAQKLGELLERPDLTGTLHLTCEGVCSWYEFAKEIFRQKGLTQKVIPCTTAEFPRPAPRPANSALEKKHLKEWGLTPMPQWQDALADFFEWESKTGK